MTEGTWTLRPCPLRVAAGLAQVLGISELTASVLVRRGLTDPDEARAFLDAHDPGHDPFLLGDMRVGCEQIRAAVEAGGRTWGHPAFDRPCNAPPTPAPALLP